MHPNSGPSNVINNQVRCLSLNARSLVRKLDELQVLATDMDLIAVTKTWLKPHIFDCKLLPNLDFTIYRKDRIHRPGGGVMLAVRNNINCVRRKDLECNAETLFCEIRPNSKRKLLIAVFYRPPDSTLDTLKELLFDSLAKQTSTNLFYVGISISQTSIGKLAQQSAMTPSTIILLN